MKTKIFKTTFVVIAISAISIGCFMAYQLNTEKNEEAMFASPLLEENLEALADAERWLGEDPCIRYYDSEVAIPVYDNTSTSSNPSPDNSDSPNTNSNHGHGTDSLYNSNSNINEGNNLVGHIVKCQGYGFNYCELGHCTKYENGEFVLEYPECAH